MAGAKMFAAAGGALASITLTVGTDGVSAYGYSSAGAYGSLSSTTFNDRAANTRTILTLAYDTGTGNLVLILSGSVPNTDATFNSIVVGDTVLSRASAAYASPSNSSWTWAPGSNIIGTSGTKIIVFL